MEDVKAQVPMGKSSITVELGFNQALVSTKRKRKAWTWRRVLLLEDSLNIAMFFLGTCFECDISWIVPSSLPLFWLTRE